MSEWHSCVRCTWENGSCRKCGRPQGSAKNWRPSVVSQQTLGTAGASSGPVCGTADASKTQSEPLLAGPQDVNVTKRPTDIEAPAVAAPSAPFPVAEAASPSVGGTVVLSVPVLGHSPLGGSAAERYMRCPGSVELSNMLRAEGGSDDAVQEEWTAEGTLAHKLLEHCLKSDIADAFLFIDGEGGWEAVTEPLSDGVQFALDYINSRPGRMYVEHKFHRPELHPLYYGQADVVKYGVGSDWLEIIDYKNGAGVVVEVEHNEQLMFYANGVLHGEDFIGCPDEMPVRLTIIQPNAWHGAGRLRHWDTTAGQLRSWLHAELLPAMRRTQSWEGGFFDMGEHCRFCPAKLACPAFENLSHRALAKARALAGSVTTPVVPPGWEGLSGEECNLLQMVINASRKRAYERLVNGDAPEKVGFKLVNGKGVRVWKDGAVDALVAALGDSAYERKLISPAAAEKLAAGPALVTEWAYMQEGQPTVAPLSDKRAPAQPLSMSEKYQKALDARAA